MKKRALITGITGQDGSYLADLLLEKDYEVHGLVRRTSSANQCRIEHIVDRVSLHEGDLTDSSSLKRVVEDVRPSEIYNLAAMSDVKTSFDIPEYTADVDGIGVMRLLEIIRSMDPSIRLYQASTSELYGKVQSIPQDENTRFYPRSPYGVAKLYAYWSIVNYREAYNLYCCNGILFNHESPRRGENFVSRKITLAAVKIKHGLQEKLTLGNLSAQRDWGYAKDFVEGMWLMLQQEKPEDFVLATGVTSTVRSFVELTFARLEIDIEWVGSGLEEKGIDRASGKILVDVSPKFFRPTEVDILIGNPQKALDQMGWKPKTDLEELVHIMVDGDLEKVSGYAHSTCS